MNNNNHLDSMKFLGLSDELLLSQCDIHIYRASGPGGQHRNKVSSAVRLKHKPTAITAQGEGSRSQHTNKRTAIGVLRMKIACQLRKPIISPDDPPPEVVSDCLITQRNGNNTARLVVSRKNDRYWFVVAHLLDLLDSCEGQVSQAAGILGISSSNFIKVLKADRHSFTAAQDLRRAYDQKPLH